MKALLVYSLILSTSFTSFVVYAADFQTAPPTQDGPGNPDLPSTIVQSDADPGRDVLARAASASLLEERVALFDNYLEDPSKECPIVRDLFADLDESEVPTLLGTLLNSMDEDWITTRSKFVADLTQFVLDHGLLGPALSHIAQQPSRFHESNLFDDDTTATKDDAYHQARIALFMLQNSPPEVVLDPGIANLFRDVILNSRMHEDADYRLIIVKALQNLNTDSVIEFMKVFLSNESGERRRITEDDHSLIEDLCRDLSDPGQWCLRAVSISNKFPLERWLRTHQSKIMEFITEHGLDEFLSIVSISESSDISSCDFEDAIRSLYNGYVLSQQGLVQDSTDPAAF